jgi:hypothetical protein
MLMQIGSLDPVSDEILALGFEIHNDIKILGLKIKKDGDYNSSLVGIESSILRQIRFCERFDLSLPGRINVAKTFMYTN